MIKVKVQSSMSDIYINFQLTVNFLGIWGLGRGVEGTAGGIRHRTGTTPTLGECSVYMSYKDAGSLSLSNITFRIPDIHHLQYAVATRDEMFASNVYI